MLPKIEGMTKRTFILTRFMALLAVAAGYYFLSASPLPAAVIGAALTSPSVQPQSAGFTGKPVPQDQLQPLVEWVQDRTGAQLQPLPTVVTDSQQNARCWLPATEFGGRIVSAEEKGRIFIDETHADLSNVHNASIIIHELTHYAQELRGDAYVCRSQREAEAFENQNAYLVEHGEPAMMDADKIARMKDCLPTIAALN